MESADGSATINALTDLDTGQELIAEPMKAYLTEAKESHRWRSNTWWCKRRRRLVHSPA
jgi:hypothetical protein